MATPVNRHFIEFIRLARVMRVVGARGPFVMINGLMSGVSDGIYKRPNNDNAETHYEPA